jgi:16S rRNA (adenine1518-N6/adenine1519-N6)-dimethyltransferase
MTTGPARGKDALKASLTSRGIAPQKKFGQNFMIDTNFAAAVARDSAPGAGVLTLEIGPGTGCLTRAILDSDPHARVLAIEIDRGLAALLREEFSAQIEAGRLTLLEGDALASKHELEPAFVAAALEISARENRSRRVLCANLPYNAATPLLANMAADDQRLDMHAAIATVQLELGQRLFGAAGTGDYGALTAFMAARTAGSIIRRIGNEVFWPRPQVDSAVIRVEFLQFADEQGENTPRLRRSEATGYHHFLQKLFSHRRKTLRAALRPLVIPADSTVSPEARAEDLAPEILLDLFRRTRVR